MRHILFGGLAALAMAGSVRAGTDAPPPLTLKTTWTVSLDASGHIVDLAQQSQVKPLIAEPLARAIRGWTFEPGRVDGRPAPTETTLNLSITLEPSADDGFAVRIDDAQTGGGVGEIVMPRFPISMRPRRDAAFSALVVVQVRYDEAGKVIAADPAPGSPHVHRVVSNAALDALRRWTFRPERVAGHGIAATVYVPVCFTATRDPRKARSGDCEKWTPPGARAAIGEGAAFALEPAARLKSDVIGRSL